MTFWLITKRQAQISIWNTSNISSIEVKIVTGDKTQQYGLIEIGYITYWVVIYLQT